jgi:hypothetical protein
VQNIKLGSYKAKSEKLTRFCCDLLEVNGADSFYPSFSFYLEEASWTELVVLDVWMGKPD